MTLFEMATTITTVDHAMMRAGVPLGQRTAVLEFLSPALARIALDLPAPPPTLQEAQHGNGA